MAVTKSKLKKLLRKSDTAERCGLILSDDTVLETENTYHEPEKGFIIPAQAFHDNEGNVSGTWHTHPGETANLSQMDHFGFSQWPQLRHYIIGVDDVRAFEVANDLVVEVNL